jgi:DNA polymerase III epsilon subunit-like protein
MDIENIQTKAEHAKTGGNCLVSSLVIIGTILLFFLWPLSIVFYGVAIYLAIQGRKEVKELEESGELYLGKNIGLLNLKDVSSDTPFAVIMDVETTGLLVDDTMPTKKKVSENPEWYPRIVQIAWLTIARDYKVVNRHNYYIKQTEPIPQRAIDIHGITNELCQEKGDNLKEVLLKFKESIAECDYYVGHNVMFDKYVIEAECIKSGVPKPFKYMSKYDTMIMGRKLMKRRRFSLVDLSTAMFGKEYLEKAKIDFHDAFKDVWVTASIFAFLHKNNIKY